MHILALWTTALPAPSSVSRDIASSENYRWGRDLLADNCNPAKLIRAWSWNWAYGFTRRLAGRPCLDLEVRDSSVISNACAGKTPFVGPPLSTFFRFNGLLTCVPVFCVVLVEIERPGPSG